MAYNLVSLVDRVKNRLGQIPETISDIGRTARSNFEGNINLIRTDNNVRRYAGDVAGQQITNLLSSRGRLPKNAPMTLQDMLQQRVAGALGGLTQAGVSSVTKPFSDAPRMEKAGSVLGGIGAVAYPGLTTQMGVIGGELNNVLNRGRGSAQNYQEAFNFSSKAAPIVGLTNPLIAKAVGRVAPQAAQNPFIKTALARGTSSALNIGQGLVIDRATGLPTTATSIAFDAALGAAGVPVDAPNVKGIKNSPLDIEDGKAIRDIYRRMTTNWTTKGKPDLDQLTKDRKLVDLILKEKYGATVEDLRKPLEQKIEGLFKIAQEDTGILRRGGIKMGIKDTEDVSDPLVKEARKYKSAEEFVEAKSKLDKQLKRAERELAYAVKDSDSSRVKFWKDQIDSIKEGFPLQEVKVRVNNLETSVYGDIRNTTDIKKKAIDRYYKVARETGKVSRNVLLGNNDVEIISKPQLTKSQLTDIYNQATKKAPTIKVDEKAKAEKPTIKVKTTTTHDFIKSMEKDAAEYAKVADEVSPRAKVEIPKVTDDLTYEEAEQAAYRVIANYEQNKEAKQTFEQLHDAYLGAREAGYTEGVQVGSKFRDIPKTDYPDVIRYMEGTKKNVSASVKKIAKELRKEYDDLYAYARKSGIEMPYRQDYVTHIWAEDFKTVADMYARAKTKFKFSGERTIPTYDEGIKMGLTPKYDAPAQIIAEYTNKLYETRAAIEFIKQLKDQGLVVSAGVARGKSGFAAIEAPGFPVSRTRLGENEVVIGNYYAPREIADSINRMFSPQANDIISTLTRGGRVLSSKIQDIALAGGVPKTPLNAFSLMAGLQKEFLAGRIVSPMVAFLRSFSGNASKKYFADNIDAIKRMQRSGLAFRTELDMADLADNGTIARHFGKDIGDAWNKTISEPTFKRFLPMLQLDMFKQIESKMLVAGKTQEEATRIATEAVRNFYGVSNIGVSERRPALTKDFLGAVFFAPKYRESMINFWRKTLGSVKDPLAPQNINNTRFIIGGILTYAAYDYANQQINGRHMHENPPSYIDKLLIPVGDERGTVIGIPFMSSLATVPRALYRMGTRTMEFDLKGAASEAKSLLSMGIRPVVDVISNENYFGQEIYDPSDPASKQMRDSGAYLLGQVNHPYVRALIEVGLFKKFGIPGREDQPTYQTISKALELPIRYYTEKSVRAGYYYGEQNKILKTLNSNQRDIYDSVYTTKADGDSYAATTRKRMADAQLLLGNPEVLEARKRVEVESAKKSGQEVNPFWELTPIQQQVVLQIKTYPPGDKQKSALQAQNIDWLKPYWAQTSAFYDALEKQNKPSEKVAVESDDTAELYIKRTPEMDALLDKYYALPYGTGQRSAFIRQHPELEDYWNEKRELENYQRTLLGLPPLEDYFSGGTYSASGGKKGTKVTLKKLSGATSAPKVSVKFGKLPAISEPKRPKLTVKDLTSTKKDYRIKA